MAFYRALDADLPSVGAGSMDDGCVADKVGWATALRGATRPSKAYSPACSAIIDTLQVPLQQARGIF